MEGECSMICLTVWFGFVLLMAIIDFTMNGDGPKVSRDRY